MFFNLLQEIVYNWWIVTWKITINHNKKHNVKFLFYQKYFLATLCFLKRPQNLKTMFLTSVVLVKDICGISLYEFCVIFRKHQLHLPSLKLHNWYYPNITVQKGVKFRQTPSSPLNNLGYWSHDRCGCEYLDISPVCSHSVGASTFQSRNLRALLHLYTVPSSLGKTTQ